MNTNRRNTHPECGSKAIAIDAGAPCRHGLVVSEHPGSETGTCAACGHGMHRTSYRTEDPMWNMTLASMWFADRGPVRGAP